MSCVNSTDPLTGGGSIRRFPTRLSFRSGVDTSRESMYATHVPNFQPLCNKKLLLHGDFWKFVANSRSRGARGARRCSTRAGIGRCSPVTPDGTPDTSMAGRPGVRISARPARRRAPRSGTRERPIDPPPRFTSSFDFIVRLSGPDRDPLLAIGRANTVMKGIGLHRYDPAIGRRTGWSESSFAEREHPQPRIRSPRGSSTASRTSVAGRRSPRISTVNSAPSAIMSDGTKPSATLFSL